MTFGTTVRWKFEEKLCHCADKSLILVIRVHPGYDLVSIKTYLSQKNNVACIQNAKWAYIVLEILRNLYRYREADLIQVMDSHQDSNPVRKALVAKDTERCIQTPDSGACGD